MNELDNQLHTDEIDLYQYWLAIRRHRMFIVVFFAVAVLATGVVSSYLPKVYRVTAIVNLGQIPSSDISQKGRPVAGLNEIQQLIAAGGFVQPVLASLKPEERRYGSGLPGGISTVSAGDGNDMLIQYDTPEPEMGKKILTKFIEEIQRTFHHRSENYRRMKMARIGQLQAEMGTQEAQAKKAEMEIHKTLEEIQKKKQIAETDIQVFRHEKAGRESQMKWAQERVAVLTAARERLDNMSVPLWNNTLELVKGKKEIAPAADKEGAVASILFANNLQQSIGLLSLDYDRINKLDEQLNKAREQIDKCRAEAATREERIKAAALNNDLETNALTLTLKQKTLERDQEKPAEIAKVKSQIAGLTAEKDMIGDITVTAAPDCLGGPIKPDLRKNLAVMGGASLFLGIFLAFFREWQHVNRQRMKQS